MEEVVLELEIKEIDRENYRKAIQKHLGIKPYKMRVTCIAGVASFVIYAFIGMISSEYIAARYVSFFIMVLLPAVFVLDDMMRKRRNKKNLSKIDRVNEGIVKYRFTEDFIETDSHRMTCRYKKEWIKYLLFYDGNMAVLSQDYTAMIIPNVSDEIKMSLKKIYGDIEILNDRAD